MEELNVVLSMLVLKRVRSIDTLTDHIVLICDRDRIDLHMETGHWCRNKIRDQNKAEILIIFRLLI
jgi:hypothetical protein